MMFQGSNHDVFKEVIVMFYGSNHDVLETI